MPHAPRRAATIAALAATIRNEAERVVEHPIPAQAVEAVERLSPPLAALALLAADEPCLWDEAVAIAPLVSTFAAYRALYGIATEAAPACALEIDPGLWLAGEAILARGAQFVAGPGWEAGR